jgi:hypothetical protein
MPHNVKPDAFIDDFDQRADRDCMLTIAINFAVCSPE